MLKKKKEKKYWHVPLWKDNGNSMEFKLAFHKYLSFV